MVANINQNEPQTNRYKLFRDCFQLAQISKAINQFREGGRDKFGVVKANAKENEGMLGKDRL